jgi:predicted SprT family Zn-dependent metalloprotease
MKKNTLKKWLLALDDSKTCAGWTSHEIQTIGLSTRFIKAMSKKDVLDTILHEIAHALCDEADEHNHKWKQTVKRLGARPYATIGEKNYKKIKAKL